MTYKKTKDPNGNASNIITRIADGACIPPDPANTDYQEYLQWAKTNTIQEADTEKLTWDSIRDTRNQLLIETDWTMIIDATVDQTAWKTYRQALRDIPETFKDKEANDVVWPTQPSTEKAS